MTGTDAPTRVPVVLSCEHASCRIPPHLGDLGLRFDELRDHVGWDIGAAELTRALAERLAAPAVLSRVSRLVIDCNRSPADADLIVATSHGVTIPGNAQLTEDERRWRLAAYHEPFHTELDEVLRDQPAHWLLSLHSFTPRLRGAHRDFEAGVLFDGDETRAHRFAENLTQAGLEVRLNEPYSGFDGLIYSARRHGRAHGRPYLEVEINQACLRDRTGSERIAEALEPAIRKWRGNE